MAPFYIFCNHLIVLTADEIRELFLGRRAWIFLLFYFATIISLINILTSSLGQSYLPWLDVASEEQYRLRELLGSLNVPAVYELFVQIAALPAPLVLFQLFSILWFPLLVTLATSDVISTDLARGTLRFVLLRTSRAALFISKVLAHVFFYVVLQIISLCLLLYFANKHIGDFSMGAYFSPALSYLVIMVPFLWCLVAATCCVSVWTRRARTAMVVIQLVWIWFLIVLFIWPKFSPFNPVYTMGMIAPYGMSAGDSLWGLSLWGACFTLLGLLSLIRREV